MSTSPSPSASASYSASATTNASMGINIPQLLVAGIENLAYSNGNMYDSLTMAGSVGISNLLPSYSTTMWNSATEKYIAEPILAGALYAAGSKYMLNTKSSLLKSFTKGFIIGSSSAAVAGTLLSGTAKERPRSIYNGLRVDAGKPESNVPLAKSYPNIIVS